MRRAVACLLFLFSVTDVASGQVGSYPQQQWVVIDGHVYDFTSVHGGGMHDSAGVVSPRPIVLQVPEGSTDGIDSLLIHAFLSGRKLSGRFVWADMGAQNELIQTWFTDAEVTAIELLDYQANSKVDCMMKAELTPRSSSISMAKTPVGAGRPIGAISRCRLVYNSAKLKLASFPTVSELSGLRIEHGAAHLKLRGYERTGNQIYSWYDRALQQGFGAAERNELQYVVAGPQERIGVWTADSVSILSLERIQDYWIAELSAKGWRYDHYVKASATATAPGQNAGVTAAAGGAATLARTTPAAAATGVSEFRALVGATPVLLRGETYCAQNGPIVFTTKTERWLLTIMAAEPRVGTTNIGEESSFNITLADQENGLTAYQPIDGSITITAATEARLTGSFRYRAEIKNKIDDGREETITGTFDLRGKTCE